MTTHDLLSVLENLPQARTLVLGDMVLDRYTWGNAERVSQEAPVLVLQVDRRETRLGGAANAANMLRGLKCFASAVGVVGNDSDGQLLRDLLNDAGIDTELVMTDPSRPTTTKERFIGRASTRHPSQILRVDSEDRTPVAEWLQSEMIAKTERDVTRYDALVISDYGKGVCTPRVLEAAIRAARSAGIPSLVDPIRICDWERYRGATVVKANRHETEAVLGIKINDPQEAVHAGRRMCERFDFTTAVITLDRDGMAIAHKNGGGAVFPTAVRDIYDITGAGDLVMAVLTMSMAGGAALEAAAQLANVAAGIKVQRIGASIVTREEIHAEISARRLPGARKVVTAEQAAKALEEHRRRGQSVVFTNGCFDLLHVGHVSNLAEASRMGDVLVVGVNSDAGVRRLKGTQRPVIGQADRAAMLAALDCVDYVIVFDDDTPHALLHALQPNVLVKGGTYTPEQVVGHEVVEAYGGKVRVTSVIEGISTTAILDSLRKETEKSTSIAGKVSTAGTRSTTETRRKKAS